MSKSLRFEAMIQTSTIEKINEEFSKAECRVMYVDANRNGSFIEKQVVEDAIPTIYNIPVIAEVLYKDGEKDFGTHGGKIVIDSNGVSIEQTTVPYGVVPESANPRWEMVDNKEYLVCDVILWTGRYSDMEILSEDENQSRPQSMEINVLQSFTDDDGYENIQDINFSALTILGAEVEACFEEARIKLYSKNNTMDDFEHKFNEMLDSYTKFNKEGGKIEVDNDNKIKIDNKTADTGVSSDGENFVDNKKEDNKNIESEEKKFALSYKGKMKLLKEALPKDEFEETEETYRWRDTYLLDFTDEYVDYEMYGNMSGEYKSEMYRAKYSMENENVTIDFEGQEELFKELITKSEKEKIDNGRNMLVANLNEKIEELDTKVTEFSEENVRLSEELNIEKQFRLSIEEEQRKENIDEQIAIFEKVLEDNEEFNSIKEARYEMTTEDIEIKCYVLIGRMNFKNNAKKAKKEEKTFTALGVENKKEEEKIEKDSFKRIEEAYSKEVN